MIKVFRITFS